MSRPAELFRPERLLAFSDGVYAVAITLLVIDIRLPPAAEGGEAALLPVLTAMAPKLVLFAFTFLVLGMSWLGHHRKFTYVERVDGRILWLNLLYLMALCLIPFASSALGERGESRIAFMLYAAVMAAVEILSALLSLTALRPPFLREDARMTPDLRRDMVLSPLLAGGLFLVAACLAAAGWERPARWLLLGIVPIMAWFGAQTGRGAGDA